MVFRHISPDMKQRALKLLQDGWEMEEIVDVLGVSSKSIGRWINNYEQHGHVEHPMVFQGRPRALNAAAMVDLQELITQLPALFLDEIAEWLALYHNQP